jgi:hypothetical protein
VDFTLWPSWNHITKKRRIRVLLILIERGEEIKGKQQQWSKKNQRVSRFYITFTSSFLLLFLIFVPSFFWGKKKLKHDVATSIKNKMLPERRMCCCCDMIDEFSRSERRKIPPLSLFDFSCYSFYTLYLSILMISR